MNRRLALLVVLLSAIALVRSIPTASEKLTTPQLAHAPNSPSRAAAESSLPLLPAGTRGTPLGGAHPQRDPALEEFTRWAQAYSMALSPEARGSMEARGVELARARQRLMADWIQTDPARVFDNQLPYAVRSRLPDAIQGLMEQPVNAKGDLAVLAVMHEAGEPATLPPVLRTARIGDQDYQVFTYGEGNQFMTRQGVPLYGLALPNDAASVPFATPLGKPSHLLALSESPARWLDPAEQAAREAARNGSGTPEPVCGVSRKPITSYGTETGFELGGNIHEFCGTEDAQRWLKATVAALGLTQPAGASGLLSTNVAASSYTEGRKKMLLMRPIWSDYSTVMTTNEALTHWQTFSNYMFEMSYGKLVLAALGKGSDITPPMLLPGLVADYDNTGLGALYENCKSTASGSYGYTLTQYDFLYVCTGSRPAASYCGLAFVGGVGFHLANRCWDPPFSGHEFGHNLGLNHAHFWDTTARSIIGDGQNMEYGDNNDPMGGGGSPNHYNSRYKNYLGWIKDADIADLNTRGSGTYRLYCFDLNEGSGLRGLKFRRNTTQNYWVNFRQRKTDKKGLMNGVQLLWTGNGNEGSYLLDVQLKGNADDNAIAIGRTFSDPSVGFHMTPVGKGNTYPESMDVVVQVGSFPSNHPPDARVIASTENPAPGDLVQLRADATDADGDPLAYYWTFGDGDYSTDNAPQASHAFPVAGEYLVQCTVSDMKGGVAHRTVVIRSGTPTTFRIRGHVLDAANRPLQGVRVFADATHFAYTDSDGSYSIVNLPPGTYSPDAIDGLAGTLSFAHPYFTNPVTVGPADADADFLGVPGPLVVKTPMIPSKAPAWRYWDSSVAPPATWSAGSFDDRTWKSGAAILGYGQGGESTILSYGSDPNNKYPTAYFRKSFVVKDPLAYASYSLEVLRDDGVIVYLNGSEIFRNNLPTGPVGFTTLAVDTVEPDSYLLASIPNTALLAGTNWITAEVHQATLNSSDLTFDLAFSGLNSSNVSGLNLAFLSQPADRGSFASGASIPVAATVHTVGALSEVAFYGDDALIGSLSAPPYELTWPSPTAGDHTLFCIARIGGLQVTSAPVRVTVDAPRPSPVALDLVGTGAEWRYLARASAAPTGWNKPGFDDTSWASGPQRLGFGHGDEATVINGGPSTARFNTLYFRHAFTVQDPASIDTLVARLKRDDGVAVYLNGIEILRDGLPQGTLLYATVATNAVDNGGVYHTFPFGADVRSLLAPGTNYLAAEVHQSSATSSDLEFELLLSAQAPVVRPRGAWVTSPGPGSIVPLPGALTLTGEAVAGDVGGIASVAFQIDGLTLAEDVTPPYSALWADPVPGLHSIVVIATDTDGATIASDPVSVTVGGVPRRSALISFGETWRYLDDGSDAGTAWTRASFDDRGWDAGAAPLGYGGNLEVTTLRQGTNSTHRNITAYFRHSILVNDPSSFTGLQLRLIRDDGAVVYVNGKEVFRSNLPGGLVSYNTLALQKIEGLDESTPVVARLPAALLSPGTNVIAVELHQQSPTDADAGFDLELTALTAADPGLQVYVATPADGARFNMPAGVPLSAEVTSGSPPIRVDYFANGLLVGTAPTFPFKVSW
ncbi:MAG TPA: hypothetical protein DCM86_10890, partial [Verrucomicrobiales bacterium]|nr:hypothetical protein [Verrucomicrobiales bacterium]